jgi:hypothetical protein
MEVPMEKLEAQLELWSLDIQARAVRTRMTGGQGSFDTLIYIDELKALHAIAQLKCSKFKAARGVRRDRLKAEMEMAWKDLDTALKDPMP